MSAEPYRSLVLGIHPNARGFGWVAFEGPFAPYDWGIYSAVHGEKHRKNERCMRRLEQLCDRLKPECIVLEHFDKKGGSPRIRRLGKQVVSFGAAAGVEVATFKRSHIEAFFADTGARTRYEIACVVARQVPALRCRLPNRRKSWNSEDKRLGLFNAADLVLAHYAFGADQVLKELKEAQ